MKNPKVKTFCFPFLIMAAYFAILLMFGVFISNSGLASFAGDFISALLFGLLYELDRKKHGIPDAGQTQFHPQMWFFVIAVGVIVLMWLVSQAAGQVIYQLGFTAGASSYTDMSKNESSMYVVTSIFAAPFAEELVFRGFGYRMWKKEMPLWAAALLSSTIFTLYHMSFVHIPVAMTVGLISCALYEMTGRLGYSVLFHFLYNLMSAGVIVPISSTSILMKPYVSFPLCVVVWGFALWFLYHAPQVRKWAETPKLIDKMNEPGADLSMFDKKNEEKQ